MLVAMTFALATATPLANLSSEYLRELWKASPMTASQAGYHHDGVDTRLDELSTEARAARAAWLRGFTDRLRAARAAGPEDEADVELLRSAVELELLELTDARDFARRCDA